MFDHPEAPLWIAIAFVATLLFIGYALSIIIDLRAHKARPLPAPDLSTPLSAETVEALKRVDATNMPPRYKELYRWFVIEQGKQRESK